MTGKPLTAAEFAALCPVSRETLDRLQLYLDLLQQWQRTINLVGGATLRDAWRRHILDSAQLIRHLPAGAAPLVDLGSGAGLPGLVLAVMGAKDVHLIESDQRKVAFLRAAARATGISVAVHQARIETVRELKAAVLTARALAPLDRLLGLAEPLLTADTVCLLLKGQSFQEELTRASKTWTMRVQPSASLSDRSGVVLKLWGIGRASDRQS